MATKSSASPLFAFGIWQDSKISSKNAVNISQGGLSLPDRLYYFQNDARTVQIREQFRLHLENRYKMMGYDQAKATQAAANQLKLESALASASRKKEDTRDPLKSYTRLKSKAAGNGYAKFVTGRCSFRNPDFIRLTR